MGNEKVTIQSSVNFTTKVEVRCTFCGKNLLVGYDDKGEPGVMHEMPACETFLKTDLLEFMVKNRKALEAEAQNYKGRN